MLPVEFIKIGQQLHGRRKWKSRLALAFGVNVSTVHRIVKRPEIPGPYEVALKAMLQNKQAQDKLEKEARKLLPRKLRRKKDAVTPANRRRYAGHAKRNRSVSGAVSPQPGPDRQHEATDPERKTDGILES
jgi:hypothetical protein